MFDDGYRQPSVASGSQEGLGRGDMHGGHGRYADLPASRQMAFGVASDLQVGLKAGPR